MDEMDKVAHEIPGIMQAASQQLVKLAEQNVELLNRANDSEHELRATKLARRMELRNIHPDLSFEDKIAQLMEMEPARLDTMEQAIELAAGGVSLGKIAQDDKNQGGASGDELTLFIESQAALT